MSDFADVTALRAGAITDDYDVDLHPGWAIYGKPNGGYLLAILARAATACVDTTHPLAVSAHYLRAPNDGPATVRTEAVRRGRRVSTARATLWQDGKPCVDALVTSGELNDAAVDWAAGPPPDMPPPGDCVDAQTAEFSPEILTQCELLVDPATAPFPTPTGEPVVRFWFRLRDGTPPDPLALVLAVDVGPPAVFNLGKYGWAPTVELTVLLRGLPAPGWLLVESRSQTIADGWFDEEATVWDSTGRVVAQARQLALVGAG